MVGGSDVVNRQGLLLCVEREPSWVTIAAHRQCIVNGVVATVGQLLRNIGVMVRLFEVLSLMEIAA